MSREAARARRSSSGTWSTPGAALTYATIVNGRATTAHYDATSVSPTVTLTPPTGSSRAITRHGDAMGRDSFAVLPGLAPIKIRRGLNGRVDSVTIGTRLWQYRYDGSGRLSRVIDPVGRSSAWA